MSPAPATSSGRRVAFLDRDGVLNVDRGYIARIEDWELLPGVGPGLRRLREAGFALAVVTNQSGIGRGYYRESDLLRLHEHLSRQLRAGGIELDAVAYCPHAPEEQCGCRKPATGMARQVESQLGAAIDYARSWMIGDKPSDLEFGRNLGAATALIRSNYWRPEQLHIPPDLIAGSLAEAAEMIVARLHA